MRYRCWDDGSSGRDSAVIVCANDASDAAELYAERALDEGDAFDAIDVHVEDEDGGIIVFVVSVDRYPSFSARPKETP